jgi:hypothetical protein
MNKNCLSYLHDDSGFPVEVEDVPFTFEELARDATAWIEKGLRTSVEML